MHLIDYGHIRDGILYHGTISDLDGVPKSTWTYNIGGEKVTWEQPIDQATFADLWNGIAGGKVFWPFIISDASEQIDPLAFHVIGVAFTHKDGLLQSTFLVPATEQDPEFVRWLGLLNVPEDRI